MELFPKTRARIEAPIKASANIAIAALGIAMLALLVALCR